AIASIGPPVRQKVSTNLILLPAVAFGPIERPMELANPSHLVGEVIQLALAPAFLLGAIGL
ncbi:MAG: hypothetical protein AAGA22_04790, partial [Pseudomonadota bacterium]